MNFCYIAIDFHAATSGGGIASYVYSLGQELIKRGHQITVISKGDRRQDFIYENIKVCQIPLGNIHWYIYKTGLFSSFALLFREFEWSLAIKKCLQEILDKGPIDLIEGCETGGLFLHDIQGLPPVVIRLHGETYVFQKFSGQKVGLGTKLTRELEYRVLRRADGVTAPSESQASVLAGELNWPKGKIQVIPNPVHPKFLNIPKNSCSPDYPSYNGPPVVLYTGRIERTKGTIPLLESVPDVVEKFPDVVFVIAGGRHNSISDKLLKSIICEKRISSHVNFLGHIPWKKIVDWYTRASVFVMPSYYETFSISVIEAMSFGLPVVASNSGALPEVVKDGMTGILVPPGNSRFLAEAINWILSHPKDAARMGMEGRKRVFELYKPECIAKQTLEFYEQVINRKNVGMGIQK